MPDITFNPLKCDIKSDTLLRGSITVDNKQRTVSKSMMLYGKVHKIDIYWHFTSNKKINQNYGLLFTLQIEVLKDTLQRLVANQIKLISALSKWKWHKYTDSTKMNRPGHTYVLNELLTADCSCKTKCVGKNPIEVYSPHLYASFGTFCAQICTTKYFFKSSYRSC